MHRFHVPPELVNGREFVLPPTESHHALKVLRCRVGDAVEVLNGKGRRQTCEITEATRRGVRVAVRSDRQEPASSLRLVLFQALTKGKSFDLVIEKATEIGVSEIVPVICERSVAVPEGRHSDAKVEKWRQSAIAAIKQCGRSWLPEIHPPRPFFSAIGRADACEWNVVAALDESARPLKEWLRSMGTMLAIGVSAGLWVGPEGDYAESEYEVMRSRKYSFARLTDSVLRAETAALYLLSSLHYEVGDSVQSTAKV
jgi:16S rRNA (uracil1498-N3)-methyltransferase